MAKQVFTTGQILTAAQMTTLQANDYNQTVSAKTANYTLVAADAGTRITMNNAGATTITVNTGVFTAGDTLTITNIGAGVCTITAGTATVSTSSTLALKQYDSGQLYFTSTGVAIFFASDAADSPLTTKGDLFTFSTQDARLAVGSNGESIVADSSTATGLRYNPLVNQNFAVNGGFDWWQRGTSFTGVSPYYTADRWQGYRDGAVSGGTFSRQTASLDGFQYCIRVSRDSGNTSTNTMNLAQSFETNDARKFHGQYATVSFWARKGALFSASGNAMSVILQTGTGTETAITNGFTSGANIIESGFTLTTSWQKFTVTTTNTVSNTATQLALGFRFIPVGTAGATDYFEVAGVQLEIGQTATAWKRAGGGTLAGELVAAQRYYYRAVTPENAYGAFGTAMGRTTTTAYGLIPFPVPMRTTPTSIEFSTVRIDDGSASTGSATAISINSLFTSRNLGALDMTFSTGVTQYRPYVIEANNSTAAYVAFSAEL